MYILTRVNMCHSTHNFYLYKYGKKISQLPHQFFTAVQLLLFKLRRLLDITILMYYYKKPITTDNAIKKYETMQINQGKHVILESTSNRTIDTYREWFIRYISVHQTDPIKPIYYHFMESKVYVHGSPDSIEYGGKKECRKKRWMNLATIISCVFI